MIRETYDSRVTRMSRAPASTAATKVQPDGSVRAMVMATAKTAICTQTSALTPSGRPLQNDKDPA
jgi:hypothetical protein